MAFSKQVQVKGDSDIYQISPNVKKYTLRDLGFDPTRHGAFVYVGSLDTASPFNAAAKLKITINADLDEFKMDTVNTSGTASVNIFNHSRADEFVTQYHFILNEMIDRDVFVKL
ncbi:DUF1831 domain-containing protein [Paucilactobacillus suebicus]|uniref:Cysteine desulfurase n=1 Tax=Paucilactobacillus suebicus DSM 5007 = KCTC 3549 TaxID=1423807 RepID=A0A0R1W3W8_9LACO|nr:DUF1831 domain-containing protein [Paucilactobacillus suebicus]KRM12544.1 hypothetical protein FD16_GL002295 [Paucilactobacillus suebicus DSM 5007 = KCTC 3549]